MARLAIKNAIVILFVIMPVMTANTMPKRGPADKALQVIGVYEGSYRNETEITISYIKVRVSFFNEDGSLLGISLLYPTSVRSGPLVPGKSMFFDGRTPPLVTGKVDIAGVKDFRTSVEFFVADTVATGEITLNTFTASIVPHKPAEDPVYMVATMEEYDQIADGMCYSKVAITIGVNGEELSRTSGDGVILTMYRWVNHDGSNLIATFQNDKLVSKAQFGLK